MTLRKIGLQTETRTNRNNEIYLGSSIVGLQGEEKVAFSSNLDFKLSYITNGYNWVNFFKTEFGVVSLGSEDFEESNDEWSVADFY